MQGLGTDGCPSVRDLGPLRGLPLRMPFLCRKTDGLSLTPLAGLPALRTPGLGLAREAASVGDIPAGAGLTNLALHGKASGIGLDGLGRWPALESPTITGDQQCGQLARQSRPPRLPTPQTLDQPALGLATVVPHHGLRALFLGGCRIASGLEPLRDLPHLTELRISGCGGTVGPAPPAGPANLTVRTYLGTTVRGTALFPPERLVRHH